MLVVENNAVNNRTFKVKSRLSSSTVKLDYGPVPKVSTGSISSQIEQAYYKKKVVEEALIEPRPDKVVKNISAIKSYQDISKLMNEKSMNTLQNSIDNSLMSVEDLNLPEVMKPQRPKIANQHIMKISNLHQLSTTQIQKDKFAD